MLRTSFVAVAAVLTGATALAIGGGGSPLAGIDVRAELMTAPVTIELGGGTSRVIDNSQSFTFVAPNAPAERQRVFSFGNRVFNTKWAEYPASVQSFDGLGPTFNRNSCSGCHVFDGRGQPPQNVGDPMESMLVRLSGPDGKPDPRYGDQLNDRANLKVKPEGRAIIDYTEVHGTYGDGTPYTLLAPHVSFEDLAYGPLDGDLISARVAPQVIGLGLLEAVPQATLEALADPNDADHDGISGRVAHITDHDGNPAVGRFGWKDNEPTLLDQAAGAALGDIGLTTSINPHANCPPVQETCTNAPAQSDPELSDSFLDRMVTYLRTLAVPVARPASDAAFQSGLRTFTAMGCAACHMPTLKTGPADLPELANQTFHPFTDLLLHDMGEGLADHRPDRDASGSEWRTAPLWGLGLVPITNGHDRLLHDGRARGFAEAILWHGGEATKAREAFRNAPIAERDALIAFLKSL
ncbi:MAG TPA: di-heme oxidoredictase family protein [Bauldia sp.]|nr:di-heme oxidoredictase family protein [Bauldia sp.]